MSSNDNYPYPQYKPFIPAVKWKPLNEQRVIERGLSADLGKKSLLGAAHKIIHLTPALGTEIIGLDLKKLTNQQKDELALLIAQRGIVFFRDQDLDVHEQLRLTSYFGPVHKHPLAPIPKQKDLEDVSVIYNNKTDENMPIIDPLILWHSEASYDIQPPGISSLQLLVCPEYGGDTLWSSGYALYSSLSRGYQVYLEGLQAIHTWDPKLARQTGTPIRLEPIETIHPVIRVHPVTGWKSVFVDPFFTTRIVGVPQVESNMILDFLNRQIIENPEFRVRFRWKPRSVAIWDNRVVTHSAVNNAAPGVRHGIRVVVHAEKPLSVTQYERSGNIAKDRSDDKKNWGLE